jgi:hypothetical protein
MPIRPLIKIKDKCINEIEIRMRMYSMLQLPIGSLVNHHFRNKMLIGRLSKSPCRDQARAYEHVSL